MLLWRFTVVIAHFSHNQDRSTKTLPVLAVNTCNTQKPQAVLSSLTRAALCCGNRFTCTGSQQHAAPPVPALQVTTEPTAAYSSAGPLRAGTTGTSIWLLPALGQHSGPIQLLNPHSLHLHVLGSSRTKSPCFTWISVHYRAEFHRLDHRFVPDLLLSTLINQHLEKQVRILVSLFLHIYDFLEETVCLFKPRVTEPTCS